MQNIHDVAHNSPYRANCLAVVDHLGNLITILNFVVRSSCNGLFDEDSDTREVLKDLRFYVSTGLEGSTVHRWAANDTDLVALALCRVLDKLIKVLVDACVLVCRHDKGITFLLQDSSGTLDRWIY
jgi:hypothetical protein